MVSHDIKEVVYMANRIVIMGSNPQLQHSQYSPKHYLVPAIIAPRNFSISLIVFITLLRAPLFPMKRYLSPL